MAYGIPKSLYITCPRMHVAQVELREALGKDISLIPILEELCVAFDRCSQNPQVHVIVLSDCGTTPPESPIDALNMITSNGTFGEADRKLDKRGRMNIGFLAAIKQDCIAAVARCPKRMSENA